MMYRISFRSKALASAIGAHRPATLVSGVLALALSAPLLAPVAHSQALEEIIITAERREATVQDIPISMTALGPDALARKAVVRLDDLQFASPSLSITDAGLTQSVNIRGIGLGSGDPAVVNGVATYVDGLFQPPIVTSTAFYDIADIQVLRGPQGTFSGANSTGGAIFINSQSPVITDELSGYLQLGAGSYSFVSGQGAINIPVSDIFAARAAFNYRDRDSYYDDLGPADSDAGGLHEKSGRVGLLLEPSDQFEALAKFEYLTKDSGGYAYRPIPGTTYAAGLTGDIRDLSYNSPTKNDEEALSALLDLRYEFDSGITIKSITGYQDKEIHNLYDADATALAFDTRDQTVGEVQWSQELNILSPTGERLEWVVGGYWQDNDITVDIYDGPFPQYIRIRNEKKTRGLFGQISYDLTDDLQLEIGARKAWFSMENLNGSGVFVGVGDPGFPPGGLQVVDLDGDYSGNDWMGKIALNWTATPDDLIYAFVARGWKPGGVNDVNSNFGAETVTDYEFGWKSTMFQGRLRTNLGLFYMDYEGFQNTSVDFATGTGQTFNLGDATIKGVELSADASLGGFRIDAAFAYVDSEMEPNRPLVNMRSLPGVGLGPQCPAGAPSNPPICFDYSPYIRQGSAGPNLYSPEITYNIGIEYTFELGGYSLTPRLNYAWIDEQWTNVAYNDETDKLDSRGLLSALITLDAENWQLQAYGRNLTDKEYVTGEEVNGFNAHFYGPPREFGVTLTLNF